MHNDRDRYGQLVERRPVTPETIHEDTEALRSESGSIWVAIPIAVAIMLAAYGLAAVFARAVWAAAHLAAPF